MILAGWNKDSGPLIDNRDANLFSDISHSLFMGLHTTTYKFCFLKSILDNLFNIDENYNITLKAIGATFAEVYWNLIVLYHIPTQGGKKSAIESLISLTLIKYPFSDGVRFESLSEETRNHFITKNFNIFKQNVIGAFYEDTRGHLFGFDKKEGTMSFNQKSLDFLMENKSLIEEVNYYEWLKMVEKILASRDSNINNLSTVLEDITQRANLDGFKKELLSKGDNHHCFYCGKSLENHSPLDHVIPWKFLKKDNLWDLVFACSTCNSKKSDRLPISPFIDKLVNRNTKLIISSPDIYRIAEIARHNGVKSDWRP